MTAARKGISSSAVQWGDRLARWMLPWGAQVLGPILLLGPAVGRGLVLFWGTPLLQFVPWRSLGIEMMKSGQVPLWNRFLGMGAPLLANYQSALLYPPNWILFFVDVAWGQGLLVIAHWIISGVGMALLARRLKLGRMPATISGLAYALSGYLVARAGFFSINAAASWLPWILVGVETLTTSNDRLRDSLRPVVGTALAFSMQWLTGHAQTSWYTLLFALAWWFWCVGSEKGWRAAWTHVPKLISALAIAFALSAPQLLPTLEYLSVSPRASSFDPRLAMTYSFWPWRALEWIAPGLLGHPARAGGYWGYGNYWEDAIYIGVLPFLLALAAIVTSFSRRRLDGAVHFLSLVGAASFLLGLGKNTPVFPFLFDHVPTFNLFQAPTRWNLVTIACLTLLAGIGADRWRAAAGRRLYWLRLATAGAAAVTLAAVIAGNLLPAARPATLFATGVAGGWLLLAGGLALLLTEQRTTWWRWLVVGVVLANLLTANSGVLPMTDASLYKEESRWTSTSIQGHRLYMDPAVEYELKFAEAFRFDEYGSMSDWKQVRDMGLPDTTLLDRISSANNFDPLVPAGFARWIEALASLPDRQQQRLLGLMDVQLAWLTAPEGDLDGYEMIESPKRVRWYSQASWVKGEESALAEVTDPAFDPERTLLLEGQQPGRQEGGSQAQILSVRDPSSGRTEVDVTADGAGWLLLSDVYYPGWTAAIDGQSTTVYLADSIFRAVHVPSGDHTVSFTYQPWSWRLGLMFFGLGLAAVSLWAWARRRWR
ncbi:MAG: YfhO family protein [Anaerolineales bacterium]